MQVCVEMQSHLTQTQQVLEHFFLPIVRFTIIKIWELKVLKGGRVEGFLCYI